jgi:hypothetical protein
MAEHYKQVFLTQFFAEGLVFPILLQGHSETAPKGGREQITVWDEDIEERLLQTLQLESQMKLSRKLTPVFYGHIRLFCFPWKNS